MVLRLFFISSVLRAASAVGETQPVAASSGVEYEKAYAAKDYVQCATLAESLASSGRYRPHLMLYNAARCHSLAGAKDAAFHALEQAVQAGFRSIEHIRAAPDLAALHSDARWPKILQELTLRDEAAQRGANTALKAICDADQSDRKPPKGTAIDWAQVQPRDRARLVQVYELLNTHQVKTSLDYFHAALVFQHGKSEKEYLLAHQLALSAATLDPSNLQAKWLAAAAWDRLLMNQKKPQKYGTQYTRRDGKMVLHEVDETVKDEERAKWNVPSLAEAQAFAQKLNQGHSPK